MKKDGLKSVATLIVLFITFLTACNKDEEMVDPFLQRTSNELNFSWEGEEKGFAITTNDGAWTVSAPDAPWITFDVTSGEGKGKREPVLATVTMNRGEAREGKILIRGGRQQSEILVRQEDGRISFGEASLEPGLLAIGENITDTYLKFPYQKGIAGDELKFSVDVTGDGASGINPILDFNVVLDTKSGEINIPMSGTPASVGEVVFTIRLAENVLVNTMPSPISAEVVDLNQPHPDAADFVISGWLADPNSSPDGNHEYIQLLALRDITFDNEDNAYSVIVCNNAGASEPVGTPIEGWATGGARSYKFNITSGSVQKGEYFYVGGTSGKINGVNSSANSMAGANWVKQHDYSTLSGDNGIGNANSGGIFANSGLPYGVAVFRGTNIDRETEPMDVIFVRTPLPTHIYIYGNRHQDPYLGEERGYRITTTDLYTVTGPNNRFFNQGDNNTGLGGTTDSGLGQNNFLALGGVYNVVTATWTTPRSRNLTTLTTSSILSDIETSNSTKMFPAP